MKKLKVIALSFALLLGLTGISKAQSTWESLTPEQKEEFRKNIKAYSQALDLSEAQKPQFASITKKYALQMRDLKDADMNQFKKYRKVKSIQSAKNEETKKLLTKKQYKVYLEKQEEMQKEMRARRK